MEKNNSNGTVTFYPNNYENSEEDVHSLSTKGRLLSYNNQLKDSLHNGLKFTELLDELIETTDSQNLLRAAMELTLFQLDTAYLVFPQQYSQSDYYLIFLNRLLQLHQNEQVILQSSDRNDELYHEFPGINQNGYFTFRIDNTEEGGAYYTEKNTGEILFYLNFQRRILHFNSRAITNLLVVDYSKTYNYETVKKFEMYLMALGEYFKKDYGFDVDFNIMDPSNSTFYQFGNTGIPQAALDKLFIQAARENFMLITGLHNEAILKLDNGVEVTIYDKSIEDSSATLNKWGLVVTDDDHKVSWFDLLFQYDFTRTWYLDNLSSLEIQSNPLYF